jgi:hypothetical protein
MTTFRLRTTGATQFGSLPPAIYSSPGPPMSGTTGNRCEIYKHIDALDEARTVADLVKRLKPILSELAYYAVTGEAAVMETREEWHSQYSDALYHATASDHAADRAPPARGGAAPARAGERRIVQTAPPSNRPSPSSIPSSLRAIMNGSHPSFKESDR